MESGKKGLKGFGGVAGVGGGCGVGVVGRVVGCGFLIRKEQKCCKLQCFESALRVCGRRGG